jgi:hypothetical protein
MDQSRLASRACLVSTSWSYCVVREVSTDAQTYDSPPSMRLDDAVVCQSLRIKGEEKASMRQEKLVPERFEHRHSVQLCNKQSHGFRLLASHHTTRALGIKQQLQKESARNRYQYLKSKRAKNHFWRKLPPSALILGYQVAVTGGEGPDML